MKTWKYCNTKMFNPDKQYIDLKANCLKTVTASDFWLSNLDRA